LILSAPRALSSDQVRDRTLDSRACFDSRPWNRFRQRRRPSVIHSTLAVKSRLAATGSDKLFLVPAILLAVAAFVPQGVAIWESGRETLGESEGDLSRALIAVYLLGVFITVLLAPKVARAGGMGIFCVILLYWLTGAASNLNAGLSMGRLSFFIVPVVFIVAWRYRPSYRDALSLLMWVSFAVCGASLLLALVNPSDAFVGLARVSHILADERLAGIFEQPNGLGPLAAIGVVLWWRREGWLSVLGVSVCALALLASDSKAAWLGCAAAFIVLVLGRQYRARPFSPRVLIIGGTLLALATLLIVTFAVEGDQPHSRESLSGRVEIWQFVADRWNESPMLGHGPGAWSSLISDGQVPSWWGQAHNQFFQTLYTTGLIGVCLLILLLWFWTDANLRFVREGYVLPLTLEAVVLIDGIFESPITLGGVNHNIWLLSILLFLSPASSQLVPVAPSTDHAMRRSGDPVPV
jgi:O-antigen ligase